jgi:hypothetical protein
MAWYKGCCGCGGRNCVNCSSAPPATLEVTLTGFADADCDGTYFLPFKGPVSPIDGFDQLDYCYWWLKNPWGVDCGCRDGGDSTFIYVVLYPNIATPSTPYGLSYYVRFSDGGSSCDFTYTELMADTFDCENWNDSAVVDHGPDNSCVSGFPSCSWILANATATMAVQAA